MRKIGIIIALCALGIAVQAQNTAANRVDSLLAQMTLREKATLLVGNGWGSMFQGIGMPAIGKHRVPGAAGETRAIERLGIPSLILSDGPAGVRIKANGADMFPCGMALAATADTLLVEQIGRAMGQQARALGVDILLGPGMNLMRNPLCGRNYEYYSENPELSAAMARAMIRGLQASGCGATAKHYALNQQETNRMHNDVIIDSTTLHDIYLRNWKEMLAAQPACIMSSYNGVNGKAVQRDAYLLDTVLRQQWGYEGVVMTDWMFYTHIADRIAAGNDLIMPGSKSYIGRIVWAVKHGKLSEERVNEAARRVASLVLKREMEKTPFGLRNSNNTEAEYDNRSLIRTVGAAACVLLKNENDALPVNAQSANKRATVVALYGATAYHSIGGGTGSGFVRCDSVISIARGLEDAGYILHPATKADYEEYMTHAKNYQRIGGMSVVSKNMGRAPLKEMAIEKDIIAERADEADVAVIVLGRQAGEGQDRSLEKDWHLNGEEQSLIRNVCAYYHARNKKVIVVLNISGLVEAESWADLPDAILCCWCPGEEVGHSVADVLSGLWEPTGRLPMSWPRRWEDLPSSRNFPTDKHGHSVRQTLIEEKDNLGYNHYQRQDTIKPMWPYGFGL